MDIFDIATLNDQRAAAARPYLEFLRAPAMSAGLYVLPAGGVDRQQPHNEDEVYYVVRGRAHIRVGVESSPVQAGSVVFVPAQAEHRFYDIDEELVLLVLFAPAETLEGGA